MGDPVCIPPLRLPEKTLAVNLSKPSCHFSTVVQENENSHDMYKNPSGGPPGQRGHRTYNHVLLLIFEGWNSGDFFYLFL